jgi:Family of unknown function (DUF5990)
LIAPPPGVAFALQRGKLAEPPRFSTAEHDLAFELNIDVTEDVADYKGPYVQGPRGARFTYVCAGTSAGDAASPWTRRIKIALGGITRELVAGLGDGEVLQARIAGKGKDGGPAAATVPILGGWERARR